MPIIPIIKAKNFLDFLLKYGCDEISIRGSHHKVYNPKTDETSVVAVHGSHDFEKGAFAKTLKQLGIDVDDFLDFMKNN